MDSQSPQPSLRHSDVMREAVRAWLSDVRRMERSARDLEQRIAEMRARITGLRGIDYSSTGPSIGRYDAMQEGVAALEELCAEWSSSVALAAPAIAEAYEVMDKCSIPGYAVMRHCLLGEKWALEELCAEWSSSVALAAPAIAEAYEVMDKCSIPGYAVMRHCLLGEKWADVARAVGYSVQSVYLMRDNGYAEVYSMMPEVARRDAFPNAAPI